jgi:hypothetical protein
MPKEMLKIDFSIDNGVYSFSDALHLPVGHTYTEQEIEDMKQARFDNWVAVITAPPIEVTEETNSDVVDVVDTSEQ